MCLLDTWTSKVSQVTNKQYCFERISLKLLEYYVITPQSNFYCNLVAVRTVYRPSDMQIVAVRGFAIILYLTVRIGEPGVLSLVGSCGPASLCDESKVLYRATFSGRSHYYFESICPGWINSRVIWTLSPPLLLSSTGGQSRINGDVGFLISKNCMDRGRRQTTGTIWTGVDWLRMGWVPMGRQTEEGLEQLATVALF